MLRTDLIASVPALIQRHANERGSKLAFQDATNKVTGIAKKLKHTLTPLQKKLDHIVETLLLISVALSSASHAGAA